MPAMVSSRDPVHIFSVPTTSTGDSPGARGHDSEMECGGAAGAGVVDVDHADAVETRRA